MKTENPVDRLLTTHPYFTLCSSETMKSCPYYSLCWCVNGRKCHCNLVDWYWVRKFCFISLNHLNVCQKTTEETQIGNGTFFRNFKIENSTHKPWSPTTFVKPTVKWVGMYAKLLTTKFIMNLPTFHPSFIVTFFKDLILNHFLFWKEFQWLYYPHPY